MKLKFILLFTFFTVNALAGFQVKTQPVAILAGLGNISLGYGTESMIFSAGLTRGTLKIASDEIDIAENNLRVDYLFNGTGKQGWYIMGGVSSIDVTVRTTTILSQIELEGQASATGTFFGTGFRWQWTSFFLDLGGKFTSYSFDDNKVDVKSSDGSISQEENIGSVQGVGLDFALGWYF